MSNSFLSVLGLILTHTLFVIQAVHIQYTLDFQLVAWQNCIRNVTASFDTAISYEMKQPYLVEIKPTINCSNKRSSRTNTDTWDGQFIRYSIQQ